ncbi:metal-dependent phosphohydrolase [soil metagenome]
MTNPLPISEALGPYVLTRGGRAVYFLNPQAVDYAIEDIAYQLSRLRRFTGIGISVAQHSVLVMDRAIGQGAAPALQLAALMHDAPEFVTGDLAAPFKKALDLVVSGDGLRAIERKLEQAIAAAFGVPAADEAGRSLVHTWDMEVRAAEVRDLFPPHLHSRFGALPKPWPDAPITEWEAEEAEYEFLHRFNRLKLWLKAEAEFSV